MPRHHALRRAYWAALLAAAAVAAITTLGFTDQAPVSIVVVAGKAVPSTAEVAAVGAPVALYLDAPKGIGAWTSTTPGPGLEEVDYPTTVNVSPEADDDQVLTVAYRALRPGHYVIHATLKPVAGSTTSTDYAIPVAVRDRSSLVTIVPIVNGFAILALLALGLGGLATRGTARSTATPGRN